MNVTLIGIDLAKAVFQVCGVNQAGKEVFNKQVKRAHLREFLAQYPGVPVAMEACSGSNFLGRELQKEREVMLIPPRHVKPFVKGNKNDRNDAFAICEAAKRPRCVCVPPRTLEQTDVTVLHKIRTRRSQACTQLTNQLRGLLNEYGIVFPQGKEKLRAALPTVLETPDNGLTPQARQWFAMVLEEWRSAELAMTEVDKAIAQHCKANESAQRLIEIKGVGALTATALVAYAGNGARYSDARRFSASLGLVPKENSSGGKQKLGSITKRGNRYLRHLLVQGAWSILRYAEKSHDRLSQWALAVSRRRGKHIAALAVANKLARIAWALLYRQSRYQPDMAPQGPVTTG